MIHLIIEYSFLYYKYLFAIESGKLPRLFNTENIDGKIVERDVSQIYYSLREIEGFRKDLESKDDVVVSVCFDMPSDRKKSDTEEAKKYKSNRTKTLSNVDFENISIVKSILDEAGYNTYRYNGYEADDLIYYLINTYKDKFSLTVIVTPDTDVLMNVQTDVIAYRYKSRKGYTTVSITNFSEYLSEEFKYNIQYNNLQLYKSTVADTRDNISGIKGFGAKAFNNLVNYLMGCGIKWSLCGNYNATVSILNKLEETGYLKASKIEEARKSLELVKPKDIDNNLNIPEPISNSTSDKRYNAYMKYNMMSLV